MWRRGNADGGKSRASARWPRLVVTLALGSGLHRLSDLGLFIGLASLYLGLHRRSVSHLPAYKWDPLWSPSATCTSVSVSVRALDLFPISPFPPPAFPFRFFYFSRSNNRRPSSSLDQIPPRGHRLRLNYRTTPPTRRHGHRVLLLLLRLNHHAVTVAARRHGAVQPRRRRRGPLPCQGAWLVNPTPSPPDRNPIRLFVVRRAIPASLDAPPPPSATSPTPTRPRSPPPPPLAAGTLSSPSTDSRSPT